MSIDQALEDLSKLEDTTRKYLIDNLDTLMNENVVFEIIAAAHASNLPIEFIDGIGWQRTGDLSGKIVNTWGDAEKPLALWFNDGTRDHWIEPKDPDGVLAWPATFGKNATAIFFMGNAKPGDMLFSKGHYVKGVPKTEAMQRGIEIGMRRLQTEILKNSKIEVSKELKTIE